CSLPCRESFFDNQTCTRELCQAAEDSESCRHSCIFIEKINRNKPGACPSRLLISVAECSAACDHDGQCLEAEKCCTAGCSRQCVAPIEQDSRLLPIPEGISVQERKRRRSAIIRWIMKRMSREHVNTNSNLFVLQWRWGVHKEESSMTPWQTIMVKNKMYAILKHLLAPGRFYVFRVGSVNIYGSLGFSKPSLPFKLTKEVKAPNAPSNFSVETIEFNRATKKWVPKISWQPPSSDLPLKDYQLSWMRTTSEFAKAYETRIGRKMALQGKRSTINFSFDEEDESGSFGGDRVSTIIPSHATRTHLQALEPEQLYMVELYATVDSTDGELRGEPAVLFIHTNSTLEDDNPLRYEIETNHISSDQNLQGTNTTQAPSLEDVEIFGFNEQKAEVNDDDAASEFHAEVKAPYYEDGQLMTTISWLDHPLCSPDKREFVVNVKEIECKKPYTEKVEEKRVVNQCVADIRNLEFNCKYVVIVEDVLSKQEITKASFKTLSCEETPSLVPFECGTEETTTSISPALICKIVNRTYASCSWPALGVHQDDRSDPANPSIIIGYRTILQPSIGSSIIHIVPPKKRLIDFPDLKPEVKYQFRVQPIITDGLGTEISTHFNTGSDSKEIRLDTFPIFELPLGAASGASISFSVYNCILLPLFLLLRLCTVAL
uniref:WAP domain-containing protein n=1 Tax=Acrobeloides nanus TaxID=290746 RepID=A0A914CR93_9BILA